MVLGQAPPEDGFFAITDTKDSDKKKKEQAEAQAAVQQSKEPESVDDTYKDDDWFDLDKYKQAAQVAYDFSIGKMQEEGDQTRQNIGKTGFEQRETNKQQQRFSEKDEARDYMQANKAYRFWYQYSNVWILVR